MLEGFWVDGENNLLHAVASRITFICPMSFNSFPMDVQVESSGGFHLEETRISKTGCFQNLL